MKQIDSAPDDEGDADRLLIHPCTMLRWVLSAYQFSEREEKAKARGEMEAPPAPEGRFYGATCKNL